MDAIETIRQGLSPHAGQVAVVFWLATLIAVLAYVRKVP